MFGIGGSEILVILVIALLFLGPDKLPEAAKQISKTVREIRRQGRLLTQTIENDEHIGGAVRDIKSALRGDEIAPRPPPKKLKAAVPTIARPEDLAKVEAAEGAEAPAPAPVAAAEPASDAATSDAATATPTATATAVRLPPSAGEPGHDRPETDADHEELAKLVKPAAGAVAREAATAADVESKQN